MSIADVVRVRQVTLCAAIVWLAAAHALPSQALGANKTFAFTATVAPESALGGSLPGSIGVGDIVTGHITFNDATADSFPLPGWGVYFHSTTPNGLVAQVEGMTFKSNPASVSFQMDIVNGLFGQDVFLAQSFSNLADMGAANPNTFTFNLVDSTATAFSSEAQPSAPYDVIGDFDPYSSGTGTRLRIAATGDYEIIAEILTMSINLVVDDDGFATPADCDDPTAVAFTTIQDAINAASAFDTIKVCPGVYIEQVYIDKPLILIGANAGNDPTNGGARGPESIVMTDVSDPDPFTAPYPTLIYVDSDFVTIDGFLLDGDNPGLVSGTVLNGADIDAEEAIVSYEGVGDMTVVNNIVRNTSYTGINFYNYYNGGTATDNNTINHNLVQNLGAFGFGIGILIYNNFYADITNNELSDVRVGIQTGNFYAANPGAPVSISDNQIASRRTGIFYNLHYSNASPFTVSSNDISANDEPGGTRWFGMLIASQQTAVDVDILNNTIDGAGTSLPSSGYVAWNTPTTAEISVSGGTVTNVDNGVWVNNYEGYNSDANDTRLTIDGVAINANQIGVYVLDSPSNTNGAIVAATVLGIATGGAGDGVQVENADASVTVTNSDLSSNGGNGIEVAGGTLTLAQNNCIANNTMDGVTVHSGGLVGAVLNNDISGNATGFSNSTGVDANASGNWWGGNTPATVSAEVTANVDYTPWLAVGTDTSPGCANGFQGDFSTLHVDDDSPQTGAAGRIQEGIDLVTASMVVVEPGTYLESDINVNKSVTIDGNGANAAAVVVAPAVSDDHDCSTFGGDNHHGFIVRSSDVLIRDLTIDGDAGFGGPASLNYRQGIVVDFNDANYPFDNIDADNVTIQNIWRRGFYWFGGTGHSITNFAANNCGVNCTSGCNVIFLDSDGDESTLDLVLSTGTIAGGTIGVCTNWITSPQGDYNPRVTISGVQVSQCTYGMNLSGLSGDSTVTGNTVTGTAAADEEGIIIQYALDPSTAHPGTVTVSGNQITACEIGIELFHNEEADTPVIVSGNTITAPSILAGSSGIFSTDDGDLFGDEDGDSYATISGNTVNGFESGIHLYRNGTSPAGGRFVASLIGGPTSADGNSVQSCTTAVRMFENDAEANGGYKCRATIRNNVASFVLSDVGVEVDGSAALIELNNISGNSIAGIRVLNDGLVDAGDVTSSNYTGLGSSMGCNFIAGYDGITSFAINDLNLDASLNKDVLADQNFWGTVIPSEIEDIVIHTADDAARTLVRFDDPKSVPQLELTGPTMCSNNPAQISVTLSMKNLPVNITGYAAFLDYDTAILSYNESASSYLFEGGSEFPLHINPGSPKPEEVAVGQINANASAAPFQPGTSADSDLATLVFDVIGCGEASVGFRPASPFNSEVSTQGIPLVSELIESSFVVDNGDAPIASSIDAPDVSAGPACTAVVSFSATIEDACCLLAADVTPSVSVIAGSAALGAPTFNITQDDAMTVSITGSVPVTTLGSCSASVEFAVDAVDCCGNAMITATATALVEDTSAPVFVQAPGSLDVTIECDETTEPGIPFAVATGGVGVYYNNNGGGENPANQAYMKAHFSYGNLNGAELSFDNSPLSGNGLLTWRNLFGQVSPPQFGLDFVLEAPTNDNSVVIPVLNAYDNTNNTVAGRALVGPVTWAINDYKGSAPNGPANPATSIINSQFRSQSPGNPLVDIEITQLELSNVGPIYTVAIAGKLVSDGITHWYTVGTPDSPMSNYALDGEIFFSGTLTYDSTGDAGTDLVDFYAGTIVLSANSPNTALGFPLATDNCTLFPAITYTDDPSGLVGCNGTGVLVRTWTATDVCGNTSTFAQDITIVDTTDPIITDPADISVIADAGDCTANVSVPPIVVTENCGSATVINDFNGTSDASGAYPQGQTTVTWTATDDCGNSSTTTQVVTVSGVNEISATVVLADVNCGIGGTPASFVRNILFKARNAGVCTSTICVPVTFSGIPATGSATFQVDCGPYTDLCAKDPQHSLWGNAPLSIAGPLHVTATDLILEGGDTDNDGDVDINDVTYFMLRYGTASAIGPGPCPYNGTRDADISINGMVGTEDYTFLVANWLATSGCTCSLLVEPGTPPIAKGTPLQASSQFAAGAASLQQGGAITRSKIRVSEVAPELGATVDLNADGWIDHQDVSIFEQQHGFSNLLSSTMVARPN